jgi:alpha-tubulin suppressor-like RCC1 family protein
VGWFGLARVRGCDIRRWCAYACAAASVCLTLISAAPAMATTTRATAIAAGREHTCVITSSGGVDCWGYNDAGQLGDGSTTNSSTPVEVKGVGGSGTLSSVAAIAAGNRYTCALTSGGGVDCWGFNFYGDLGDGTVWNSWTPMPVKGVGGLGTLSGVVAIAAGTEDTCALTSDGGVDCWGVNFEGDLGDGSSVNSSTPVEVKGVGGSGTLSGVKAIAVGDGPTCALMSASGVDCWGLNDFGQLGDGSFSGPETCTAISRPCSRTPAVVKGVGGSGTLSGVAAIAAEGEYTCALMSDGEADCWGYNDAGQLGDGSTANSSTPAEVKDVGGSGPLSGVKAIAAGHYGDDPEHTCAVMSGGGVDCWGGNDAGQLGDGNTTESSTPVEVKGVGGSGTLSGVEAIAAGDNQTCALTSGGGVDCWGGNDVGQLGDGSTVESSTPVVVPEFGSTSATITTTTTTTNTANTTTTAGTTATNTYQATTTATTTASTPVDAGAEAGQAIVKGGKAALKLTCAGPGACKGTVKLVARVSEKHTVKRHGKRRVVTRTREVVIVTADFSLTQGASETLNVHLSAKGEQLLRTAGKNGLQVSLAGSGIKTRSLLLRAPKSKG